MNRWLASVVTCVVLSASAWAQEGTFELQGRVAGVKTPKVYLMYRTGAKNIVDTAEVKDGSFRFTGLLQGAVISRILSSDFAFESRQYIEPGRISVVQEDPGGPIVVTGSPADEVYAIVREDNRRYEMALEEASKEYEMRLKTDSVAAKRKYTERQTDLLSLRLDAAANFIKAHPASRASLDELEFWASRFDGGQLQMLYASLDTLLRHSTDGLALGKQVEASMRGQIGMKAVDFNEKNVNGQNISLSSFRGRYVLVQFWASWCKPCRQENPGLVKIYEKFKDRGFQILGVSLDNNADRWKDAIRKDGLTWPQVSDLGRWNNAAAVAYFITSIPANFLIDASGIIIAKNVSGSELEKKLNEIYSE